MNNPAIYSLLLVFFVLVFVVPVVVVDIRGIISIMSDTSDEEEADKHMDYHHQPNLLLQLPSYGTS